MPKPAQKYDCRTCQDTEDCQRCDGSGDDCGSDYCDACQGTGKCPRCVTDEAFLGHSDWDM